VFQAKKRVLEQAFQAHSARIQVAGGDLREASPFRDVDPTTVKAFVHGAAVTRFNVDPELAQRTNVEGTAKALAFARTCPALESFALLSTLYASGLQEGRLEEMPLEGPRGFANHYEWSKWCAEAIVLAEDLPWPRAIYRVATILSDDDSGSVTQYNAFHNTLKLIYYGLVSLVPGIPATRVFLVTAQDAAQAIRATLFLGKPAIYNLSPTADRTPTLGDLIDQAFAVFGECPDFRDRRIMKPLFVDETSFTLLKEAGEAFSSPMVRQALASIAPFAPQLFLAKEPSNRCLVQASGVDPGMGLSGAVTRTLEHLATTRWGRRSVCHD
jgi:nucleoside-diphosphate-sugar epimerase